MWCGCAAGCAGFPGESQSCCRKQEPGPSRKAHSRVLESGYTPTGRCPARPPTSQTGRDLLFVVLLAGLRRSTCTRAHRMTHRCGNVQLPPAFGVLHTCRTPTGPRIQPAVPVTEHDHEAVPVEVLCLVQKDGSAGHPFNRRAVDRRRSGLPPAHHLHESQMATNGSALTATPQATKVVIFPSGRSTASQRISEATVCQGHEFRALKGSITTESRLRLRTHGGILTMSHAFGGIARHERRCRGFDGISTAYRTRRGSQGVR